MGSIADQKKRIGSVADDRDSHGIPPIEVMSDCCGHQVSSFRTKSSSSRQVPGSASHLTSFHVRVSGDKVLAKLCCHEHCTLQF